jgi:hypothetical protein
MYFVVFLLYPLLSRTIFHMFQCQTLHDHEAWHVDDFDVDCNSGEYTAFYAIAMVFVFIYPIGIPVGLFILLWRDEQHDAELGFGECAEHVTVALFVWQSQRVQKQEHVCNKAGPNTLKYGAPSSKDKQTRQ